ncbi:MAG: phosphatidate cytidylyltransferase [Firmicutes bacterium]|nr:phosphatidate cytidylyltransferase [Bacillota bacterium]
MQPKDALGRRLMASAFGIPLLLVSAWAGGWLWTLLIGAVAALGAMEMAGLFESKGAALGSQRTISAVAAFALVASVRLTGVPVRDPVWTGLAGLGAAAAGSGLAALVAAIFVPDQHRLSGASAAVFGSVYTGGLLSFLVLLREVPLGGFGIVALVLAATWATDSAAFFVGRGLGRHKLVPRLSPAKTIEGALGGLAAGTLAGSAGGWFLSGTAGMGLWQGAFLGILVAVAAQVGDLVESALKRSAGVKDSGRLIPGHGGILDRFDSLMFVAPAAFLFLMFLRGGGP